jgi:hypothetical protein
MVQQPRRQPSSGYSSCFWYISKTNSVTQILTATTVVKRQPFLHTITVHGRSVKYFENCSQLQLPPADGLEYFFSSNMISTAV